MEREAQEPSRATKSWYRLNVPGGHVGIGREQERLIYVYARDVMDALRRARYVGGWKKSIDQWRFPDIRPLTEEEVDGLKQKIAETPDLTYKQAKRGIRDDQLGGE